MPSELAELQAEYEHRKKYHTQCLRMFQESRDMLNCAADAMEPAGRAVIDELQRRVDEKKAKQQESGT